MMLVNSGHYKENCTIWFHALPLLLAEDYYFLPSLFWPPTSVPVWVLLQALASLLPSQHLSVPSVVEVDESLLPDLQVCPEGFICYCESTCNHGHVTWKIWHLLLLGMFPGKPGLLTGSAVALVDSSYSLDSDVDSLHDVWDWGKDTMEGAVYVMLWQK